MTTEQTSTPTSGRAGGHNGLAVAALVTGIVGVVFAWLFAVVGLALGVVAVSLGAVARRNGGRTGQATAGLVLGAVAIISAIVNMVIVYDILT
jgi:hypothetical protein